MPWRKGNVGNNMYNRILTLCREETVMQRHLEKGCRGKEVEEECGLQG